MIFPSINFQDTFYFVDIHVLLVANLMDIILRNITKNFPFKLFEETRLKGVWGLLE